MMDIAIIATDLALYFKLVFLLILRINVIREFPPSFQWLRLGDFTAIGPGSVPSRGNKILQAGRHGQTKKNTDDYKNNEHHSSN